MSSDMPENCRVALNEQEEEQAEMNEGRYLENADDVYDRVRDDNSIELMEDVEKVIENANKLMYFKNRPESIAQDIIQAVLSKCNVRIEIQELSESHQHIRATLRKPIKSKKKISV